MNKKRLLKLADFLETKVPRERFNMAHWCSGDSLKDCGTTACALGWATAIPSFRRAGLYMDLTGDPRLILLPWASPIDVAMEFFDLTSDDAHFLFMPEDEVGVILKRTPKQEARVIRKLVARADA